MTKSTEVMRMMNKLTRVTEVSQTMQKLQEEMTKVRTDSPRTRAGELGGGVRCVRW